MAVRFIFSSSLQIWYVEVRISKSIVESSLDFEIMRIDCIWNCMSDMRNYISDMSAQWKLLSASRSMQSDQSSISASRNFASLIIQNVPSEDSDQIAQKNRLIWICKGHTCPKVCFLMGPVVQSVVSLTTSLVVKLLIVLESTMSNSQVFLLKKCE